MSKFNLSSSLLTRTENYMGGTSFKQSAEEELIFAVITSFIEDSYYESKDERVKRIASLVEKVAKYDPLFVAKLAVITRREFHMRSAFHVLIGELSKYNKGNSIVKNTIKEGVERVDDLTEILAYVGKPIPNQIKKGIRLAINKFNIYQLSKYRGEGKEYSLVDLMNIVHPTPSQNNKDIFKKLIKGELKSTETWETKMTETGKLAETEDDKNKLKASIWKDLISSKKIGYMALLRNLRNILEKADSETIKLACDMIADPELVKKSKQLPFRFLSAYEAIEGKEDSGLFFEKEIDKPLAIKRAIRKAIGYSISNIPILGGKTIILTDNSGSMRGDGGGGSPISAISKRKTSDIANLFAVLYWMRTDNTIIGVFGDNLITPRLDRGKDIFENYKIIDQVGSIVGGKTETGIFTMIEKLIKEAIEVDRIVIFSDCQVGRGCKWYDAESKRGDDFNKLFEQYKGINPSINVYSIDLKGYGNAMFDQGVFKLAGWSDKIFNLMEIIEKKDGLIKWIENYPINL